MLLFSIGVGSALNPLALQALGTFNHELSIDLSEAELNLLAFVELFKGSAPNIIVSFEFAPTLVSIAKFAPASRIDFVFLLFIMPCPFVFHFIVVNLICP